jgi:hypothetical protein
MKWDRRLSYPQKEVAVWIFVVLKSPLSSAGFNPRTLGLILGTLTIRPPRTPLLWSWLCYRFGSKIVHVTEAVVAMLL